MDISPLDFESLIGVLTLLAKYDVYSNGLRVPAQNNASYHTSFIGRSDRAGVQSSGSQQAKANRSKTPGGQSGDRRTTDNGTIVTRKPLCQAFEKVLVNRHPFWMESTLLCKKHRNKRKKTRILPSPPHTDSLAQNAQSTHSIQGSDRQGRCGPMARITALASLGSTENIQAMTPLLTNNAKARVEQHQTKPINTERVKRNATMS